MEKNLKLNWEKYKKTLSSIPEMEFQGQVMDVEGCLIKGFLPGACVRGLCEVTPRQEKKKIRAEVIGFQEKKALLMPLGEMRGVGLGSKIVLLNQKNLVKVGEELMGRVVNSLGEPIDNLGALKAFHETPLYSFEMNPLDRIPVSEPLDLGVRPINGLITMGKGQRIAVISGSGVGKSVLLGMISKFTQADVNVIAMIGERGREVREFVEKKLGKKGLSHSVVVVATSDQTPLLRVRGAFFATAVAEYFCKTGRNVLLIMDSVTRFAMAQREIGLSVGEAPGMKGYTPSVFSLLPQLIERAGRFESQGSVTGLYSVLVEGDDLNDPIGDAVRSIADGHIILDRKLAQRGHFPAIDILSSVSRVMSNVVSSEQKELSSAFRENLAIYKEAEDLIRIGAYKSGSDKKVDLALKIYEKMLRFLRQKEDKRSSFEESLNEMKSLFDFNLSGLPSNKHETN